MNTKQAKEIPIKRVLDHLGYKPARERGSVLFYFSLFKEEKTPSLKVDTVQNLWFDFSISQGGSVIDLVMNLYKIEIREALRMFADFVFVPIDREVTKSKNDKGMQEIKKIQRLQNRALIEYLENRKIRIDIAKEYLEEIYFSQNNKNYFGLCWKNESGGYEVRNKYFKGLLQGGQKDITMIQGSNRNLLVFEGYIDFLSFLSLDNICNKNNNYMILNSLVMIKKLKEKINEYEQVFLYLDNDRAGREATAELLKWSDKIFDESLFYKGYKDLNEYLLNES